MTDIYRWWSKKALKGEILKLKLTYNELFDAMRKTQEENRELKKHLKINDKAYNDIQSNNEELRKQLNDFGYTKLEEAIGIIREFVEWANWQSNSKCPSFKSIQDKAEQFLKECEK